MIGKELTFSERYEQEYLKHYGVKGMKWGARRKGSSVSKTTLSKEEKQERRAAVKKKVEKVYNVAAVATSIAIVGPFVAAAAASALQVKVDSAVRSKQASNGRKYAMNLLSDSRGLTSYQTIDLAFNSSRKRWD